MPLMKTLPASMRRASALARSMSRVHSAAPRPNSRVVGQADGLVRVAGADDRGHRAERLLAEAGHVRRDAGRAPSARRSSPCPLSALPPVSDAARPPRPMRPTWSARSSRRSRARQRADIGLALAAGSPTASALTAATNRSLELVGDGLLDDEALGGDAALAVVLVARAAPRRRPPRPGRRRPGR